MMSVDDLPARGTAVQFVSKPEQLGFRHTVGIEREKLDRPGGKRVAGCRHSPARAFRATENFGGWAVGKAPVVVAERRVKWDPQRIVQRVPPGFPASVVGA